MMKWLAQPLKGWILEKQGHRPITILSQVFTEHDSDNSKYIYSYIISVLLFDVSLSFRLMFERLVCVVKAVARGVPQVHVHPPFQKKKGIYI